MKILVIRLGRIGDMILSTPLLKQLESNIEGVQIDVLASRDNHLILEYADYIDNVFLWDKNPLKLIPLVSKLRLRKYDVILEPKDHFSTESYYIAGLLKAKRKIGYKKNQSSVFNDDVSKYNSELKHFQDKILSTIKAFGIEPDFRMRVPLTYPKAPKAESNRNKLIFNISASKESKKIPLQLAKEIILYLKEKDIVTLLMFAPEEKELALNLNELTKVELANTKSITDTFGLIDNSRAVISADTSIVHIAGTYNKPIVVISKSIESELEKFAPKSDFNIIVRSKLSEGIEVDKVALLSAIDKLIEHTK